MSLTALLLGITTRRGLWWWLLLLPLSFCWSLKHSVQGFSTKPTTTTKASISLVSSLSTKTTTSTTTTTIAIKTSTRLLAGLENIDESTTTTARRTTACFTRRQWFAASSTAAAAAAVVVGGASPAAAAEIDSDSKAPASGSSSRSSPTVILEGSVCDPSVSVWKKDRRILYLLGTAHISEQSAQVAGQLVRDVHPNAVFVELDLRRVASVGVGSTSSATAAKNVRPGEITTTRLVLDPVNPEQSPSRIIVPRIPKFNPQQAIDVSSSTTTITTDSSSTIAATAAPTPPSSTTALAMTSSTVAELENDNNNDDDDDDIFSPSPTTNKSKGSLFSGFRRNLVNLGAAAVGNAIRGMYQNLNQAGFNPGEEFALAMTAAQETGADIVLGDRDVQITLQRLTQALAVTDFDKLMAADSEMEQSMKELFGSSSNSNNNALPSSSTSSSSAGDLFAIRDSDPVQFKQELSRYVETLKSRDRVRTIMGQLKEVAPALVQVMLTERDTYMATGLDILNEYQVITAVMGVAHQDGVEQNLASMGWNAVPVPCQTQILARP